MVDGVRFARSAPELFRLRIGLFRACAGAAAALVAAAELPQDVSAASPTAERQTWLAVMETDKTLSSF
jgi:hypothetical protein